MGQETAAVCIKCQESPASLMQCKECLTYFCGKCYPPFVVDTGVIADRMDICPKCDSREVAHLKKP